MSTPILISPVITEKSMLLASRGVFTFEVDRSASKGQVRSTVETLFKVNVTNVTTSTVKNEGKRSGRKRMMSKGTTAKFARVTLKQGQSIELFDMKEASA